MTRTLLLLLAPLLLVVAAGCHGHMARLSGTVKYKGQPVSGGSITFHAPEGGIYAFPLKPDGTYSGTEVPAGDYVVTVETESANPKKPTMTYGQQGGGAKKAGGDPNDYRAKMMERNQVPTATEGGGYVKIPSKYSDKKKSGLQASLGGGSNTKDFDLTD
jgi:hypothetical protein